MYLVTVASIFYHNMLNIFVCFEVFFAVRITGVFLAKCSFNVYVVTFIAMVSTICVLMAL